MKDLQPDDRFPATREEDGVRIEIGFVGEPSGRLLSCVSTPSGDTRAGVVMCPPLHADFAKNYRNEVLLGWALSQAGFAVIRFHYRGQGHSDGDAEDITLDSLRADVRTAVEHLVARTGVSRIAFFGCRLGAFIASTAAALYEGAPLALWEPVVDPSSYLREALRARLIGDIKDDVAQRESAQELALGLKRSGHVDIHGYPIHNKLIESLQGRTLAEELGDGWRPVMFLHMGRGEKMRAEHRTVTDGLTAAGLPVDVHHVSADVGWWFRGAAQAREQVDQLAAEAVATTTNWMGTKYTEIGASR